MTPSAVDAILILTAPFTFNAIEWSDCVRLLTKLLVSDCRVLMERLVDRANG